MPRVFSPICTGLFALLLLAGVCSAETADWRALGVGVAADTSGVEDDVEINHLHVWNNLLVASGEFGLADGSPARNIAAWDGSGWSALGDGLFEVWDVITHNGVLTVLGRREFVNDIEVVQWDGSQWTHLVQLDEATESIASYLGDLYVSGNRYYPSTPTTAAFVGCWISKWNGGSSWSSVARAEYSGQGIDVAGMMTILRGELYATFGPWGSLISWDGSQYTSHDQPQVTWQESIVDLNGTLYVGGRAFPGDAILLGKPDGFPHWRAYMCLENGPCPDSMITTWDVQSMIGYDGQMVVAGRFDHPTRTLPRVVRGDSTHYEGVGSDFNNTVIALAEYEGSLIAAGRFTEVGGIPVGRVAEYPQEPTTPVAITGFTGRAAGNRAELSWTVFADEAFDGFQIYRSGRGGPYHAITAVPLHSDTRHYTDTGVVPGERYSYYLAALGASNGEVVSVPVEVRIPEARNTLHQNYPNPFNPETVVRFELASPGQVRIDIYTTDGRRIRSLLNTRYGAGAHDATWDGVDDNGNPVASGVYYYRMRMGNESFSKKMVLLK